VYRTWHLLTAAVLAAVLALVGCDHPAAGAEPRPSPNPPPWPGPYASAIK
jgi:hypothetical protein